MHQSHGPGDQLALEENRHSHHLIRIVDTAIYGVIGKPQISIVDADVLAEGVLDVLDDDGRNHGMQVGAHRSIDDVAIGGADAHQRVSCNPHSAATGALEHFHAFVEDVVGALETDLELRCINLIRPSQFIVRWRDGLEPGKFLFECWNGHDRLRIQTSGKTR